MREEMRLKNKIYEHLKINLDCLTDGQKQALTSELMEIIKANPLKQLDMPKIAEVVKDIMQEGFDVAMYGNPFEAEDIIKEKQEKLYDEVVKKYTKIISNSQLKSPIILRDGDLVVVSHFSDFDYPFDAVQLGIYDKTIGGYYYIKNNKRGFRYCKFVNRTSEPK